MTFKKLLPYLLTIGVFIIISLAYFYPVLQGKELFQSDIAQFMGMSKEIREFREQFHEEPYWTNRAFGGMPAYQLSAHYPHDYIGKLDSLLRFLPRPADYLFLYFIGFFVLLSVLRVGWKMALIGALGFGFSTYLIIILGVGHNAKAHAIAYMPMVLAGILLVFRGKALFGFLLTAIAMALEIQASHPQMTYYLLFSVLLFGLVNLIQAFKDKELSGFFANVGILAAAVILAVGVNATSLLATREYAAQSTRSASELTLEPDGTPKERSTGLSREYITEYSFGLLETFDIFIPRFMGGSNNEDLGKDSYTYEFLKDKAGRQQALNFARNAPTYWGDQPIVAAPPYVGAVFIYLFVLGALLLRGPVKKWLLAATIFSIVMSWGKNFGLLTDLFIDYVPLYNKFRAVSSIQVIAEISIPLLGILALKQWLEEDLAEQEKLKAFKWSTLVVGGLALLFTAVGTYLFAFESYRDPSFDNMLQGLADALVQDRRTIFFQDSLRTLIYVVMMACVLWLYLEKRIRKEVVLISFFVLTMLDLVTVARRYVNENDFVASTKMERPFESSPAHEEIQKDKGHYRVLNFMVNPMNDGSTSYFHNSVGGYHAAKPRRYQELFDYQIARNNMEVLHMLNTKYIIFPGENNQESVQLNQDANGNAWFVDEVVWVDTADEEIRGLDSLNTKMSAVVRREYKDMLAGLAFERDSKASIRLTEYRADQMTYEAETESDQLAVFSEMYYENGWKAYVDGEPVPHLRANYVLRALVVPKGRHSIVFRFEPEVIRIGSGVTLVSYAIFLLAPLGWYLTERKRKNVQSHPKEKI